MLRGTIRFLFVVVVGLLLLATAWQAANAQADLVPPEKIVPTVAQAIDFCRAAHYNMMNNYGDTLLKKGMEKISKEHQASVAIICWAYGEGYLDALKEAYVPTKP